MEGGDPESGQDYKVIVLTQQDRNYLRKTATESRDCAAAAVPCRYVKAAEVKQDVGATACTKVEEARIERAGVAGQGSTTRGSGLQTEETNLLDLNKKKASDPDYAARRDCRAARPQGGFRTDRVSRPPN